MEYRRRQKSDCWHFHRSCRWWPVLGALITRMVKPKSGEFCNECMAKAKRNA